MNIFRLIRLISHSHTLKLCAKIDSVPLVDGITAKRSEVSKLIDRGRLFKINGVVEKWPAYADFTIDNLARVCVLIRNMFNAKPSLDALCYAYAFTIYL